MQTLDRGSMWRSTRVPFLGIVSAFRYGDDNHAVSGLYHAQATDGDSPSACLRQLLEDSGTALEAFNVEHRALEPLGLRGFGDSAFSLFTLEVSVAGWTNRSSYLAAVAFHPKPRHCVATGFAVAADEQRALARRVRERWIREAAPGLDALKE
jgi:hypothetical protein